MIRALHSLIQTGPYARLLIAFFATLFVGRFGQTKTCDSIFQSHEAVRQTAGAHQTRTILGREIVEPTTVLDELYRQSRVLGFANSDHDSRATQVALIDFLQRHGTDRELKTIVIEIPSEMREFFEKASVTEPTAADFAALGTWAQYLDIAEPAFWMSDVLPAVRNLNLGRASDPLLLVPIDSVTRELFFYPVKKLGASADIQVPVSADKIDWSFVQSIDRERGTAVNFERDVRERFPNRKSIVLYQHAHLLRGLRAYGVTNGDGKPAMIDAPLAWIDYAVELENHKGSRLAKELKIALFDRAVGWNPSGAIAGNAEIARLTSATGSPVSSFAYKTNGPASGAVEFVPGSFLNVYRNGSVRSTNGTPIADAVIWTDATPQTAKRN